MTTDRAADRLVDALIASDAAEAVMVDALRAMTSARFVLAVSATPPLMSLLERSEVAVDVLGRAIERLQYALNLREEEPEDG